MKKPSSNHLHKFKRVKSGYECLCGYWARRAVERDLHLTICVPQNLRTLFKRAEDAAKTIIEDYKCLPIDGSEHQIMTEQLFFRLRREFLAFAKHDWNNLG